MGVIFYVALILAVKLAQTDAQKNDYCAVESTGTLELNKVHVPGVGLPVRMQKVVARIPSDLCGDIRKQVGISVIACDVREHETPRVRIVNQHLVRVHRQGYAWLSEAGDLIIMVSCGDVPKEIEFPEPD